MKILAFHSTAKIAGVSVQLDTSDYTKMEVGSGVAETKANRFFRDSPSKNTTFFDSQVTKKLIYDLHETFCAVQELARTNNEILRPENAILISQRYRMAIRTALENVQDNDREKKELVLHRELYNADVLWSLTEAVYIQSTDNPLVIDLINWGLHCFGNAAKTICDQVVEKADAPETHQYYWNALVLSIVHADFNSAMREFYENTAILNETTHFSNCALFFRASSLPLIPESKIRAHSSKPKRCSGNKVRDSLRSGTFKRSSEELEMIAGILIGKMESFEKCGRSLYDFWYELLPAYVLFTCPGADLDNIGKIAQTLYQTLCPTDTHISTVETMNTEIDRPIFSILCKKLPEMLKQICENSVSWWFPVHLCDLFQKLDPSVIMMLGEQIQQSSGRKTVNFGAAENEDLQPQRQRLNADENVRTSMIIDYGTALLESYDFWNISYSYVLSCGAENATYELDSCLVRLNLDSVKKAEQLYVLSLKHELPRTKAVVARSLVERYVKNGHYNEALSWALRSELSDLINLVSNKMLSTFNAEAISQLRIFDATSTMFLNYPNLLLLQRFYQFRRFLVQGQASEAAGKLYELVTSGMAPIAFQVVLFDQMTKLLDPSTTDFIQVPELDRDSIYDLMKAVNNFELQNAIIHPSKAADNPHTVELQTKIKFLRQALCSALALRSLS
ncbi:Rab11-binding and Nucleoporin domain containing protein [Aphelenchoides besseyi]|nr:Rab11-binding and Nucleoporin domain containing protein [Aphelenchoides besseyi]